MSSSGIVKAVPAVSTVVVVDVTQAIGLRGYAINQRSALDWVGAPVGLH